MGMPDQLGVVLVENLAFCEGSSRHDSVNVQGAVFLGGVERRFVLQQSKQVPSIVSREWELYLNESERSGLVVADREECVKEFRRRLQFNRVVLGGTIHNLLRDASASLDNVARETTLRPDGFEKIATRST